MTEVKTRKARTKKANVEEKYNLQVPISKEIEEKLRQLADELDLTLAQYARCVLIKHCKGANTQALFTTSNVSTAVNTEENQSTTTKEEEKQTINIVKNSMFAKK